MPRYKSYQHPEILLSEIPANLRPTAIEVPISSLVYLSPPVSYQSCDLFTSPTFKISPLKNLFPKPQNGSGPIQAKDLLMHQIRIAILYSTTWISVWRSAWYSRKTTYTTQLHEILIRLIEIHTNNSWSLVSQNKNTKSMEGVIQIIICSTTQIYNWITTAMTNWLLLHCIYYVGFDFSNGNVFEITVFVWPLRVRQSYLHRLVKVQ